MSDHAREKELPRHPLEAQRAELLVVVLEQAYELAKLLASALSRVEDTQRHLLAKIRRVERLIRSDKQHVFEAGPEHIEAHMQHCQDDDHMGCVYVQAVLLLHDAAAEIEWVEDTRRQTEK